MSDSALQPIQIFLNQTEKLLLLAQADQWEEFEVLLAERQKGMAALGESPFLIAVTKAGLVTDVKEMIQKIKDIDQQIAHAAEQSKAIISEQLRQSLIANKALDAYKS